MQCDEIIEDIEKYLLYLKEEGQSVVEMDRSALEEVPKKTSGKTPENDSGLDRIAREISKCRKCQLHETRTKTVPGQGNGNPQIMFIGEAPGGDEDRQGIAFVGRAGQLLTKMIEAMGLTRDEVFIGNILKCRPPNNRTPLPEEMETCFPYLERQIEILQPEVIIALGATAVGGLVDTKLGITKLRGQWMSFKGIRLMPTFHPAYLLRNQSAKHDVWEDLQEVLKFLGRTPPQRPAKGK